MWQWWSRAGSDCVFAEAAIGAIGCDRHYNNGSNSCYRINTTIVAVTAAFPATANDEASADRYYAGDSARIAVIEQAVVELRTKMAHAVTHEVRGMSTSSHLCACMICYNSATHAHHTHSTKLCTFSDQSLGGSLANAHASCFLILRSQSTATPCSVHVTNLNTLIASSKFQRLG